MFKISKILPLIVSLGFISCSENEQAGPYDPNVFLNGEWNYTKNEIVENTCDNDSLSKYSSGMFFLDMEDSKNFTVDNENFDNVLNCEYTLDRFNCLDSPVHYDTINGVNVKIIFNINMNGNILQNDRIDGFLTVRLSCSGSDCELVSAFSDYDFPCYYKVAFEAEHLMSGESNN